MIYRSQFGLSINTSKLLLQPDNTLCVSSLNILLKPHVSVYNYLSLYIPENNASFNHNLSIS